MNFIKQLRAYFFRANAPINPNVPNDKKDNLSTEGVPSQGTMERLLASCLFFLERGDRAKQTTGVENDEDLVGHVQITTDEDAKAYESGLINTPGAETTKVVHGSQLTETVSNTDTLSTYAGVTNDSSVPAAGNVETVEVTIDPAETRRNKFLLRFTAAFSTYLNNLVGNISYINSYVFGTGGRDNPGENGTGLGGVIYGPGGDPGNIQSPSILETLFGGLPGADGASGSLIPVGTINMWSGGSAPNDDWKICNGEPLNTTTFATLFGVVNYTYGGSGSTFNLPNLQGKFPAGAFGAGDYALGNTAGTDSNTLQENQVPLAAHTHGSGNLGLTGAMGTIGSNHQHKMAHCGDASSGEDAADMPYSYSVTDGTGKGWNGDYSYTGAVNNVAGNDEDLNTKLQSSFVADDGQHTHDLGTMDVNGATDANTPVAAAASVENRPSFIAMNYIIKVK